MTSGLLLLFVLLYYSVRRVVRLLQRPHLQAGKHRRRDVCALQIMDHQGLQLATIGYQTFVIITHTLLSISGDAVFVQSPESGAPGLHAVLLRRDHGHGAVVQLQQREWKAPGQPRPANMREVNIQVG